MIQTELTRRERAVLSAIADCRYATVDILARWTHTHPSDVRRGTPSLVGKGLAYRHAVIDQAVIWSITNEGAEAIGRRTRFHQNYDAVTVRHDLAVAETMLTWQEAGWSTEPTPRLKHHFALDNDLVEQPKPRYTRRDGWRRAELIRVPGRFLDRIIPDFEATHPDTTSAVAVEIELTRKAPNRVAYKLHFYRQQSFWQKVIYYTDDPGVERLVRRAVDHSRTQDLVEIRPITLPRYLAGGYLND